MPRVPHYQTTPFTIDPSARSTQTFAERYGVSPPHSNENLYGNDYTINDDKCSEAQARNHKAELSKATASSSHVTPTTKANNNNNSNGNDAELSSKAFKSTVIKGSKNAPNNTHSTAFDVEQRLQVSWLLYGFINFLLLVDRTDFEYQSLHNYIVSPSSHHLCQKQFFESLMRDETCFHVRNVESFSFFLR